MTYKEAAERIEDHMIVHKMQESRAVKITEALKIAIDLLLWAEEQPEFLFESKVSDIINEYYESGLSAGFARARKIYNIKD